MRPNGRHTAGVSQLSALRAWAMGLLLLSAVAISPTTATAAPSQAAVATTHVYLLRGVLNIFSLGLDTIGARLQAQGIPVTVANFVSWSSLADEAATAYKAGRLKTIVLVGHSSGATALPDMIAKLNRLGVPVKLAIGLDSVFKTKLSTGAERYINIYIGDGPGEPVKRADRFSRQARQCRRPRLRRRPHLDRQERSDPAPRDCRDRRRNHAIARTGSGCRTRRAQVGALGGGNGSPELSRSPQAGELTMPPSRRRRHCRICTSQARSPAGRGRELGVRSGVVTA
ncbi:hypothetical protein ACVWZ6_007699 [Bradyrhizobium sp. GM6.1]